MHLSMCIPAATPILLFLAVISCSHRPVSTGRIVNLKTFDYEDTTLPLDIRQFLVQFLATSTTPRSSSSFSTISDVSTPSSPYPTVSPPSASLTIVPDEEIDVSGNTGDNVALAAPPHSLLLSPMLPVQSEGEARRFAQRSLRSARTKKDSQSDPNSEAADPIVGGDMTAALPTTFSSSQETDIESTTDSHDVFNQRDNSTESTTSRLSSQRRRRQFNARRPRTDLELAARLRRLMAAKILKERIVAQFGGMERQIAIPAAKLLLQGQNH